MADDNIVSLAKVRADREGPDAAHRWTDEAGVEWFEFECEYLDGDRSFCFRIWATSFDDADRRVGLIKQTAFAADQVYKEVPN